MAPSHSHPEKVTRTINHGHSSARGHARILHTSDWQLGMERWFLKTDKSTNNDDGGLDSQALYTQARFTVIKRMADIAHDRQCDAVVVAGDVFDSPQVEERIQSRFIEAIERFAPIPIAFLPGNHDPYQIGSVWNSSFANRIQEAGGIIISDNSIHHLGGIEVVGAPLTSNKPTEDTVSAALRNLEPSSGVRVLIGHGQPRRDWYESTAHADHAVDLDNVDQALSTHQVDYIAMGDTHSVEELDDLGGMWFSGSPEPTDLDDRERDSGYCLVVDIDVADGTTTLTVDPVHVAEWSFHSDVREVNTDADIEQWFSDLNNMRDASTTVVRSTLSGRISLEQDSRIEEYKQRLASKFAAFYDHEGKTKLSIVPDSLDADAFNLHGYFRKVLDDLDPEDDTDREALRILYQLNQKYQESE